MGYLIYKILKGEKMIYKDIVRESFKKLEVLKVFSEEIEKFQVLINDYDNQFKKAWDMIPSGSTQWTSNTSVSIKNIKVNSASGFISKSYNMMQYYDFLMKLNDYSRESKISNDINEFKEYFQIFIRVLDEFLNSGKQISRLPKLINSIRTLVSKYQNTISEVERIQKYDDMLENSGYSSDEILELQFYKGVSTSEEIMFVISTVSNLYTRGLHLFQLNEREYPLEIIKIETGTFYEKIKGDPLMTCILGAAFTFMLQVTYDGYKSNSEEATLDKLSKALDIRGKMVEQGLEPSGMDEEIKSYEAILFKGAKKVSKLSSKVRVNDEILELEKAYELRFLEDQKGFVETLSLPDLTSPDELRDPVGAEEKETVA